MDPSTTDRKRLAGFFKLGGLSFQKSDSLGIKRRFTLQQEKCLAFTMRLSPENRGPTHFNWALSTELDELNAVVVNNNQALLEQGTNGLFKAAFAGTKQSADHFW